MTDKELYKSPSFDDLNIFDREDYVALADTIPSVDFVNGDVEILEPSLDCEDDFSDYISYAAIDDNTQLPSSQHLRVSSSLAQAGSVSPSCSFSPLPPLDCEYDLPDWLFQAEDMGVAPEGIHKSPAKSVDESLGRIFSSALKEEIRLKIQLKRVTSGQEELKVDISPPGSTICYDAVKKRNEVREKNKEYAKQSRDRMKSERMKQEEDNQRLKQRNKKLKHKIINMKQKILATDDFLQRHHKDCPVCYQVENTCSICTKTRPRTFHDVNESQKLVRLVPKLTEAGDRDLVPGPSGLSTVKTYASRSETGTKTGNVTVSCDFHAARQDIHPYKVLIKDDEREIRHKVTLYEDSTSSVSINETKDDKGEDTAMKGKRRANVMNVFWGENDLNYDRKLNSLSRVKRRLIVSDPILQFHEAVPSAIDHPGLEDDKDQDTVWNEAWPITLPQIKVNIPKEISSMDIILPEIDVDLNTSWRLSSPTISSSSEILDGEDLASKDYDSTAEKEKDPLSVWMVKPPAIVPNPKRHDHERLESSVDYLVAQDKRDKDTLFPGKQRAFVSSSTEQVHEHLRGLDSVVLDILDHG